MPADEESPQDRRSRERFVRVSVAIAVLTLVARLGNGALHIVLAAIFGTSVQFDAYLVGQSIPTAIAEWFMLAAPAVVLVPLLIGLRADGRDDEAWRLTCAFANILLIAVAILSGLSVLLGPQLVAVLAPGIGADARETAASVLRITTLALIPTAAAGVMRALLQARHRFLAPAVAGIVSAAIMLAFAAGLAPRHGVDALAVGTLAAAAGSCAVIALGARDLRRRYHFGIDVTKPLAHRSLKLLAAFLIIGTAAQINFLSDRFFASFLPAGSISVLSYGEKLASFFMMIFATAVAVPAYSAFSQTIAQKDIPALRQTIMTSLRLIATVTAPVLVMAILLREPLIRLLLQRGVFTAGDARAVSTVFAYLCGVFLIYAFAQILTYAFFALQETGRFLALVVGGIALNIALDAVLYRRLGVAGLAIATLTSTLASNSVCWWILGRRLGGLGAASHAGFALKVSVAALTGGAVALAVTTLLAAPADPGGTGAQILRLAAGGACGTGVYARLCLAMRVDEVRHLVEAVTGRLRVA